MKEPIQQVVIERLQPNPDGLEWNWAAFGEDDILAQQWHQTLTACVDGLRTFLARDKS